MGAAFLGSFQITCNAIALVRRVGKRVCDLTFLAGSLLKNAALKRTLLIVNGIDVEIIAFLV